MSQSTHQSTMSDIAFMQSLVKKQMFTPLMPPYDPLINIPAIKLHCCKDCGDKFVFKSSYMEHIFRDSVNISYLCKSCKMKYHFTNRCSLMNHIRSHIQSTKTIINISDIKVEPSPHHMVTFLNNFEEDEETISMEAFLQLKELNMVDSSNETSSFSETSLIYEPPKLNNFNIDSAIENISKNFNTAIQELEVDYQSMIQSQEQSLPVQEKNVNDNLLIENSTNNVTADTNDSVEEIQCSSIDIGRISPSYEKNHCKFCYFDYGTDVLNRKKHYQTFHESISCSKCNLEFMNACSYKAHQSIHTLEQPFICPECGQTLHSPYSFYKHVHTICFHLARMFVFVCCEKSCTNVSPFADFSKHFTDNHVKYFNKCSLCSATYFNINAYYNHLKTFHKLTNIKPKEFYSCNPCSKELKSKSDILQHVNEVHKSQIKTILKVYKCPGCLSIRFPLSSLNVHSKNCEPYQQSDLAKHLDKVCGQESFDFSTKYQCSQCGILTIIYPPKNCKFCIKCSGKRDENIVFKITAESMRKLQNANSCHSKRNFNFTSLSEDEDVLRTKKKRRITQIKKHVMVGSGQEISGSGVAIHDGTESNQTMWNCAKCSLSLSDETSFLNHIFTHRDSSTAYQCMNCGLCFVTKQSLSTHLIIVHGNTNIEEYFEKNDCKCNQPDESSAQANFDVEIKENQCRVCLDQFKNSADLDKHFRIHGMAFILANQKNKNS